MTTTPSQPRERELFVRCDELAPRVGDLDANLAMIEASIRRAVDDGVELLVLPELATSGYYLSGRDEAAACALPADAAAFSEWAALLGDRSTLVVGFCETDAGTLYNSAAVISRAGVLGIYRKTHLWDEEKAIFTPGAARPPIVTTPAGDVGVMICYDLEFPEMPRSLALAGADLITVPTNWPTVEKPDAEHPPEVILAMAAARASRIPVLCCDRRGTERGNTWTQGTTIIDSDGWPAGRPAGEGRIDARLPLPAGRTRIGPRNDVFTDRRPDLY